ncbi:acyl-CoA dehydrogenase family protein [Pseudonocardia endophytica]|uniref:Alkylation response protein AidB-like acyl-CoA dehydrogenase n=1 Tax=Pseudonocardia endophytica TaxID=401976 RepID=A0A4R1HJF6_PSEEN|nr:acyl-CoA dehydrogenase family protein [Pseudonocardia endophytica]TCK21988.1 alkylation response protein AidB-like acyl-CoA dehydrogenase [Pseudonocardia endophytica]
MDFTDSERSATLREELRALVREHVPSTFLGAFTRDPRDLELSQAFCRVLAENGRLTPAWPVEYGGSASTPWEQTVVREEMWAHFEPRGAQYMGVNWVGPAIMRFGTDRQKDEHLSRIAAGTVIWCQGFSEPEAGSDLASLRTAAVPDGDGGWRIEGQKVWTSYATMADWCFLLARTDRDAPKHKGITVFLVPMDRPGIKVVPIDAMVGPHHLNEVFFENVPVTADDVLGEVDAGWSIVREALAFERVGIARYARCDRLLNAAPATLGERWGTLPAELRQRWASALIHTRQARLLAYRVIDKVETGEVDPADTASYRIAATQTDQEVAEVLMDIIEEKAVGASGPEELFVRAVDDHWRYAQAATVASGSIEVQRMLLSRALLKPRTL